jgi:hypothetical protein
MDCPQCGYVMGPFEKECPRCIRLGGHAPPAPAPVEAPKEALATRVKTTAKDTVSQFQAVPLIKLKVEEPEYGWPMAIALWTVIGINILLILAAVIIIVLASDQVDTSGLGLVIIFAFFSIVGAWALMTYRRWGFRVMVFTTILPGVLRMMGGEAIDPITFIFVILPAIAGAVALLIGVTRWDEFE